MSPPRQQGKALALALLASLLGASGPERHASSAAATEQVVVDRHSGLAILGFDPVAYFIEARAAPGRQELELARGGVVWRFRNEGNRAEFTAHPDIYAPRFGGYDPLGVARDVAIPGNPLIWMMREERLYFFRDEESRAALSHDVAGGLSAAEQRWPEVSRSLAR